MILQVLQNMASSLQTANKKQRLLSPSRERKTISHQTGLKENHRLKHTLGGDILVSRRWHATHSLRDNCALQAVGRLPSPHVAAKNTQELLVVPPKCHLLLRRGDWWCLGASHIFPAKNMWAKITGGIRNFRGVKSSGCWNFRGVEISVKKTYRWNHKVAGPEPIVGSMELCITLCIDENRWVSLRSFHHYKWSYGTLRKYLIFRGRLCCRVFVWLGATKKNIGPKWMGWGNVS